MYLLDTNHCSNIIIGNPTLVSRLADLGESRITTCVIVQGEPIDMAERSQQKASNLRLIQGFLQGIYIHPIDGETAETYGRLKALLFNHFGPKDKSKRRQATLTDFGFGENDLWIAAVALRHQLTLVSADRDFQRIQQVVPLKLESWM